MLKFLSLLFITTNIFAQDFEWKNHRKLNKSHQKLEKNNLEGKSLKAQYEPIFKLNIEDQSRQKEPFENFNEEESLTRQATLEVGIKEGESFSLKIKSNIGDINYDPQNQENQLNIEPNKEINNFTIKLRYKF